MDTTADPSVTGGDVTRHELSRELMNMLYGAEEGKKSTPHHNEY